MGADHKLEESAAWSQTRVTRDFALYIEVVFVGSDAGEDGVRQIKMQQNFARSMSVADAMNPNHLPCYEMDGEPLPQPHGFPLRLIVPGWYGIANVKWPRRIEVRDTRFMGRFMGRDYVTIREEQRDGESAWMKTSVGRALLKSVPARVTRENGQYRIIGAAWGAPIQGVEGEIDGGPWVLATIDRSEDAEFAWKSWSLEWQNPFPGEHTIVSRAIDAMGHIQPAIPQPSALCASLFLRGDGIIVRPPAPAAMPLTTAARRPQLCSPLPMPLG
jgi:Oxidoreductase molybdopterin binding domain